MTDNEAKKLTFLARTDAVRRREREAKQKAIELRTIQTRERGQGDYQDRIYFSKDKRLPSDRPYRVGGICDGATHLTLDQALTLLNGGSVLMEGDENGHAVGLSYLGGNSGYAFRPKGTADCECDFCKYSHIGISRLGIEKAMAYSRDYKMLAALVRQRGWSQEGHNLSPIVKTFLKSGKPLFDSPPYRKLENFLKRLNQQEFRGLWAIVVYGWHYPTFQDAQAGTLNDKIDIDDGHPEEKFRRVLKKLTDTDYLQQGFAKLLERNEIS